MPEQLYYLTAFPPGQAWEYSLRELGTWPGWKGIEQTFAGNALTDLPLAGKVPVAPIPPGCPPAGFICAEVTSTFDLAWELLQHGLLPCWGFVLAATQNSGRGQLRRPWQSAPGNIYATFRLPEALNTEAGALLTGYLLHRALGALGVAVDIKWPNDLVQNKHKVGGILLEERGGAVLAGVWLNIAHAPDMADLTGLAGLTNLTGQAIEDNTPRPFPAAVLRAENDSFPPAPPAVLNAWLELVKQVTLSYEQDLSRLPPERRPALLESCLAFKGLKATVFEPCFADSGSFSEKRSISGVINGLGPKGELRLLLPSGRERLLHSGTLTLQE